MLTKMYFRNVVRNLESVLRRPYSSKQKIQVAMDGFIEDGILSKTIKARKHPGVMPAKSVAVPPYIIKAISILMSDKPVKTILLDSSDLDNYLQARLPPNEFRQLKNKTIDIYKRLEKMEPPLSPNASQQEIDELLKQRELKAKIILAKTVYNWAPIPYDEYRCLLYLMARAAPEYASLYRIFDEIRMRAPDFQPDSFFDYGSGVGTGVWAARQFWADSILEYFTVDSSSDMNDLARLLLCGGNQNIQLPLKSFYQRQFLPASSNIKYDLVLSAYSLFELPNAKSRLETIGVLWRKTQHFLVLVEQGTNAGFRLLNEARDYILQLESEECHVFAPCPGDFPCPRFAERKTPCNFLIMFSTLGVGENPSVKTDVYSYIILRKRKRKEDDPQWPRIVRTPLIKGKHTICRMCTSQGTLQEVIFTKRRHGKPAYWCARSSSWGDLLPMCITKSESTIANDSKKNDNKFNVEPTSEKQE